MSSNSRPCPMRFGHLECLRLSHLAWPLHGVFWLIKPSVHTGALSGKQCMLWTVGAQACALGKSSTMSHETEANVRRTGYKQGHISLEEHEFVILARDCHCTVLLAVLANQSQACCTPPQHVLQHLVIHALGKFSCGHKTGRAPQRLQAFAYAAATSALPGQSAKALNSLRTALTKAPKLRSALSVACSSWMPATSGRHCVTAPPAHTFLWHSVCLHDQDMARYSLIN